MSKKNIGRRNRRERLDEYMDMELGSIFTLDEIMKRASSYPFVYGLSVGDVCLTCQTRLAFSATNSGHGHNIHDHNTARGHE